MINKYLVSILLLLSFSVNAETITAVATEVVAPAAIAETVEVNATASEAVQLDTTAPLAATETAKLAEDQIPLAINNEKKSAESGSAASKALFSALIVLSIIGTTYYFVKKYKVSNTINKSNMQIKVLSQHHLGPKKSLAIIHVAGESMLVGITDNNISMIKSLSLIDDEVPADMPNTFGQTMAKKANEAQPMIDDLDEEFSFAGVTDTVSKKIKSMRSFS